jgi:hypothetical protein
MDMLPNPIDGSFLSPSISIEYAYRKEEQQKSYLSVLSRKLSWFNASQVDHCVQEVLLAEFMDFFLNAAIKEGKTD